MAVTPARRVDGQPILLAASIAMDGTALEMGVVDERTFQVVNPWPAEGNAAWLAAPP
jgi:hypothetical protein